MTESPHSSDFEHSETLRVAIYARASTKGESQRWSIKAQTKDLRAAIALHYSPRVAIVDSFTDRTSGSNLDRPGLKKLLSIASAYRAIWVLSPDRLSRSLSDWVKVAALLPELHFVNPSVAYDTPSDRFIVHLLVSAAEHELQLIRSRTRAGLAAAREDGVRLGRPPALQHHEVLQIIAMRQSGNTWQHIAHIFWHVGISTARRAVKAYLDGLP